MSWISKFSRSQSSNFVKAVSSFICQENPFDLVKHLDGLIQKDDFLGVARFQFSYAEESNLREIICARQIHALVSKQAFLPVGIDRKAESLRKFLDSEVECAKTNIRLSVGSPNGDVGSVLHRASQKISYVLGELPDFDAFDFSFGPGASTNVKSADACFRSKLSARLTCSIELLPFIQKYILSTPDWLLHHAYSITSGQSDLLAKLECDVVPGKLSLVPKTALIDRPIIVEPLLNGFYQKGVGSYIRDRLMRYAGVDLRSQELNKYLAFKGSISGKYATVDLSSASDTISLGCVFSLLPFEWSSFLSSLRTGFVKYENVTLELEKFSSMGNGFTFELESLIFWALTSATHDHLNIGVMPNVYGDDIITVPEAYELLSEVLDYLGFSLNREKSFASGPFRESCGADYFKGFDVRPFYLRKEISEEKIFSFHNFCIRNGEPSLAKFLVQYIHPDRRIYGPDGFGDGHLIGSHRLRRPRSIRRSGWCGGYFDTFQRGKRLKKKPLPGDWLVPQYSVYTRSGEQDPTDPFLVRGSRGYSKTSVYTLSTSIFRRY